MSGDNSVHNRSIKESLLLLMSGGFAVAITPLIYLRMRDENWTHAYIDAFIVGVMMLLFMLVYVSRRTRTAGIVLALGFISFALISTLRLGAGEIYWAFPALVVAYFMLDTRKATIVTGVFVTCFLTIVWNEIPAFDLIRLCLALTSTVLLVNAFALTNRRQLQDLSRLVHVDPLTGAGNRRAQNLKLDTVTAGFRRNESPASLLILDIDFFKRVNDTYGHTVGDQILLELTALLRRNTRATESVYRYGGEEFVLVAEHSTLNGAMMLAEKLRSQIEREFFATGIPVTVSIGVAELRLGETKDEWLGRADAALYRAKGRGRNQVILAESSSTAKVTAATGLPDDGDYDASRAAA